MTKLFVLARTPGADATAANTVEWESICHDKQDYVLVWHDRSYERSRWVHKPRKRPFAVGYKNSYLDPVSHHVTLEAAMKAARKLVANYVEKDRARW
jgi:hypothetical protein